MMVSINGFWISHGGPAPYVARSAGKGDDWPMWYVAGHDGINRVKVEGRGVTLFSREMAERIAAALNEAKPK